MDQKIIQQGRIFKNINSINGMKEFSSEKSTLKLYVDNINNSLNSINNLNLNSDRQTQVTQRAADIDLTSSPNTFIYKQNSSRPPSQKASNLGIKISDLVRKKSNTYKSYLTNQQSMKSINQTKQNDQSSYLNNQQKVILNSAKTQIGSQSYQLQGLRKDNYFQMQNNTTMDKYLKGEVSIIETKRNNNSQNEYLKLSQKSDIKSMIDKKINSFNSTFQDSYENQEMFNLSLSQKYNKQSMNFLKVGLSQSEQIGSLDNKNEDKIEQVKSIQPQQDLSCKINIQDSEYWHNSKDLNNVKRDSLNVEEYNFQQKISKGTNSSFVSIGSKTGQQDYYQDKNYSIQMQSASRSNLGSIYNSSTCNTTPAGGIHNPEQITQQLVKQNLMIFNRKELFSASKNSNTYTNSQKLIQRQNQNKNLYKNYINSQSNSISRQTSLYSKNLAHDLDKLMAKTNRKQTEKQIQSLDSEISAILVGNQSDRIFLSRNIQGNPQIAGMGMNELKETSVQKLSLNIPNLKNGKDSNIDKIEDDIVISPIIEQNPKGNSSQKVGDDKKNFIKDIISKKNQKQIPLIDAPFFQNKILQQDNQFEFMQKVYSPKQIKQQFQDSIQVNQLQKQNSLSVESLTHSSPRHNYLINQIESLNRSHENLQKSQITQKEQEQSSQSSIQIIKQQHEQQKEILYSPVSESQIEIPKTKNEIKIKFIDKRYSDSIQQKKQENQILHKASSEAETQTNACEKFLKNVALRPKTGIPYHRNRSLLSTPRQFINPNQQINNLEQNNNMVTDFQSFVQNQLISRSKTLSQKQQKQPNQQQKSNQTQQFSPWQDNHMEEQYDQEDSLDFIQYTISS